jgi:hypothetical protein
MSNRQFFMAAAIVAFSGVAAAQAAPAGVVIGNLLSADAVGWERVALRRCWQRGGVRHCRSYRGGSTYGFRGNDDANYYVHDADKLPYGTSRWWDEMMRENRAGNPGGGGRN